MFTTKSSVLFISVFYISVYLGDHVIQNISMLNKYLLLREYFRVESAVFSRAACSLRGTTQGKITNSTGCCLLTELLWAQTGD